MLDQRDEVTKEVIATKAAYERALAVEAKIVAETNPFVSSMKAAIHVMFGNSAEVLADFGLAPRRIARARTLDEKVEARDKRKETLDDRHAVANGARSH